MSPAQLVALYPSEWRDRYGDEFLALLEERPPRGVDVPDILFAALHAHLFPEGTDWRSWMLTRFMGLASTGAGIALLLCLVPMQLSLIEGIGKLGLATHALPVFYALALFGFAGIHLAQVRTRPNIAWPAFAVALIGLVMGSSSVGLSLTGGGIPNSDFGILQAVGLWVGSAAMGAAILAIGVLPRTVGFGFLIGASLAIVGPLSGDAGSHAVDLIAVSTIGVVVYALAWLRAGVSMLTAQPREGVLGTA